MDRSPPPHFLTADSTQQPMGEILFWGARGHIREYIARDHRYYPRWPEPMCIDSSAQRTGVFLRWGTYGESSSQRITRTICMLLSRVLSHFCRSPCAQIHLLREQGSSFTREPMQRGHLNGSYIMPEFCAIGYSATLATAQGHNFKGWDKVLAAEGSDRTIKWQTEKKASSHSITYVVVTALHSITSSDSA